MQSQRTDQPRDLRPDRDGLLILSGYGLRLQVQRKRLAVQDGVGRDRRCGALHRATSRLRRLVVLGHSGFVTLDALRWLHDVGAAFVQIDDDGQLVACCAPEGVHDVHRRRAQALAAQQPTGMLIARALLDAKLRAQAELLRSRGSEHESARIVGLAGELAGDSPERVRFVESRAADIYWRVLATTPVRFAKRDEPRVPSHWRSLGSRHSPLSRAPRNAVGPANALLNYVYTVLEAETRIALLAQGLDPEMGLLHSTRRFRNSLAHDLMEPLRPLADQWLLDLLARRTFAASDFIETREGACRLTTPLAQAFSGMAPVLASRVAPLAQWLASALDATSSVPSKPVKLKPVPALHPLPATLDLGPRCRTCGVELPEYRQKHCAACAAVLRDTSMPRVAAAGQASLRRMRLEGRDPTHSGEASKRRAQSVAARHAEARVWTRTRAQIAADRRTFVADILPRVQAFEVAQLARLTGLSKAQCSLVRTGRRTLHPRHWAVVLDESVTQSV